MAADAATIVSVTLEHTHQSAQSRLGLQLAAGNIDFEALSCCTAVLSRFRPGDKV